ncbi:nucleotidyl transferase AbiEii/AbiGii toxin family protein [Streptomyces cyaneofuscatus]|uniref:nucleotidyl transferase AbiEii/AbiGii toxin family protein n=1 Tax=Streptomyces cyaneofuscatus TaxID=66883 RepID=UPI0036814D8E
MVNPTRDTTAGRAYNDLRKLARRNGRSTDEVMVEYVLERFLYRLAASPLGRKHFILKGGLLLAQFGARRTTRDIDILGHAFSGEEAEITRRIAAITDLAERRQSSYAAWRRRQEAASTDYPHLFTEVVGPVITFADPLLAGIAVTHSWNSSTSTWT